MESEKEYLLKIRKLPKDIREYIIDLLQELSDCYQYMEKKEKLNLIHRYFADKHIVYERLYKIVRDDLWFKSLKKEVGK